MVFDALRADRALRRTLQRIDAAKKQGDFSSVEQLLAQAADVLTRAGRAQDAVELYASERNYFAAAGIAERHGLWGRAAKLWLQAKDHRRAAKAYLQDGQSLAAAEALEMAGDARRTAEICEEQNDFVRAAAIHEKLGDHLRAANLLVRALKTSGRQQVMGPEAHEVCRRAGALYATAGEVDRAVAVLKLGGLYQFAGELLAKAGRNEQAIQLLEASGDLLAAAEIARSIGDEKRASALLAQRAMTQGRVLESAIHYGQAGRHLDAARLYQYAQEPIKAAAAYEEAGVPRAAADLYEQSGHLEDAIRCLHVVGDDAGAAQVQRITSQMTTVRSGEESAATLLSNAHALIARARQGERSRYEDAIRLLEKVPIEDPDHTRARRLLATTQVERGDRATALAVLEAFLGGRSPTVEDLGAMYQRAKLLEMDARLAEARSAYKEISKLDPAYLDVSVRLRALEDYTSSPRPSSAGMPGPMNLDPSSSNRNASFSLPRAISPLNSPLASTANSATDSARPDVNSAAIPLLPEAFGAEEGQYEAKPTIGMLLRNRFRLERMLGAGSQAQVFLARDVVLDRLIAIKIFRQGGDPIQLDRFLAEARMAARIRHRTCLTIFDFGQESGLVFVAMEYFPGETIKTRLLQGRMDPATALRVAVEVADALCAIHRAGIIHRDVKPSNIMIDHNNDVRLADFGVAAPLGEASASPGVLIGTLKYMAPEQAGASTLDERADIYSLGVVIYEMLTGIAPFKASVQSLIQRMATPPPEIDATIAVERQVRDIVRRCLQPDPNDRYKSMMLVLEDLKRSFADLVQGRARSMSVHILTD